MNIGITQNYNTNYRNNIRNSQPAFRGATGEKLLKEITTATDGISTQQIMNEVKGMMGPNKAKVQDVVESFIGKIKELTDILPEKETKARGLSDKINLLPNDWAVESKARDAVYASYAEKNKAMAERSREVQQRLETAKKEASVYEPMKEVKSIEELGLMMPEQIKGVIDETNANKNNAAESMFNFLMSNGDGKEATAQIDRYKTLFKVGQDGMFNIPELSEYQKGKHAPSHEPAYSALDLIKMALKGNPQGSYLESYSTANKVKEKSMDLLRPLCRENSWATEQRVKEELDKSVTQAIEFHRNFPKGKEKLIKNNPECEVIDHKDGYDTLSSKIELKHPDGYKMEWTYDNVASIGGNRY